MVSVNWPTRVITVEIADLTLVSPNEYTHDVDQFRLALKDLEDDEGMPFPDTHLHIAPISFGTTSLARVVEIINNYTITYEDGQYSVSLIGANSNIGDVVNLNQVSIRSNNTAGLVNIDELPLILSLLRDTVYIDTVNGEVGVDSEIGYPNRPSNNLTDALTIATANTIKKLILRTGLTFTEPVENYNVLSEGSAHIVTLTGQSIAESSFQNLIITGQQNGLATFNTCTISGLTGFTGQMRDCGLVNSISLAADTQSRIINGFESDPSTALPTINISDGASTTLTMQKYSGCIQLTGLNNAGKRVEINLQGGQVFLDNTCTAGTIQLSGIGGTPQLNGATCTVDESKYVRSDDISSPARGRALWTNAGTATTYTADGNSYQTWTLHKPDGTTANPEADPVADRRPT